MCTCMCICILCIYCMLHRVRNGILPPLSHPIKSFVSPQSNNYPIISLCYIFRNTFIPDCASPKTMFSLGH